MTATAPAMLADAWTLWRRRGDLVMAVAAPFVFLPQYALLLLTPEPPQAPASTADTIDPAYATALTDWLVANGGWYVAAALVALAGQLTLAALFLDDRRPSVGGNMVTALTLLPRFVLATLAVMMPLAMLGAAAAALVSGLALVVLVPGVWVIARTALIGPVLVAERGTGALAALARSWRLTRGHGAAMVLLVLALPLAGEVLGSMVLAGDRTLRALGAGNPVALSIIDAVAAGIAMLSTTAMVLAEVAAYRRLAAR